MLGFPTNQKTRLLFKIDGSANLSHCDLVHPCVIVLNTGNRWVPAGLALLIDKQNESQMRLTFSIRLDGLSLRVISYLELGA